MAEAMEQPTAILVVISAVALAAIGGAFYVSYVAATEPPVPPGVVNAAPAAQQPAKEEQGNPLPVQPGAENQPVVNAPAAGSSAQAPGQPKPGDGG